jgi:hypothetical protein
LINQRKELDKLPEADYVVPVLEQWKYWSKMSDWDSRNRLLERLIAKLRRREASAGEIQVLVVVCRPTWAKVASSLRRYGGVPMDPGAEASARREEARRVNELDRDELDQVIQHALLDALLPCPWPLPPRFFPSLEAVLVHRALDHVRQDLTEHDTVIPHDNGIREIVEAVLADESAATAAALRAPASPARAVAAHARPRRDLRALARVRDLRTHAQRLRARRRPAPQPPAPGRPGSLLWGDDPA